MVSPRDECATKLGIRIDDRDTWSYVGGIGI